MQKRRFEALVRAHHGAVRTYAGSLASSTTIADDATQETFLRAWRHLDSFRGDGSFEGWLIRIARHCVFDLEARERRARRNADEAAQVYQLPPVADEAPETMAVLATLAPTHREVLVLCGVLGYDYASAAVVLDVPVGTVRSRLHRARLALASALDADADARTGTRTGTDGVSA